MDRRTIKNISHAGAAIFITGSTIHAVDQFKKRKERMEKVAFNLVNTLGKSSLGISRKIMPQIKSIPDFVKRVGAPSMKIKIKASALSPSQSFIDSKKVENFKGRSKDILISRDGRVVDGHHRWAKAMVDNKNINAVIVDMPTKQLINKAHELTKTALSKGFKLNALHDTLFRSNARLYDTEKAISKTHEILKKTPDNKIAEIMSEANLHRKIKRKLETNPITNMPFGQKKIESRFVSSANLTPDQMNSTELARFNKVAELAFKDEIERVANQHDGKRSNSEAIALGLGGAALVGGLMFGKKPVSSIKKFIGSAVKPTKPMRPSSVGLDKVKLDKVKLDTVKLDKIKLDTIELDKIKLDTI